MALIVEYHVVADMYPVGATAFDAGELLTLTNNLAVPAGAASTAVVGVAGDSALDAEGQTTAYSAQLTIGANGAGTRWTENRVSDFYDETTASQKVTVYNGGGKFWISEDLAAPAFTPAAGSTVEAAANGLWQDYTTATAQVGLCVGAAQAYDSGVPGTDTSNGSISLGNYFPVVLRI
jgi:hypothetical protein